jgi:hypothetical protein
VWITLVYQPTHLGGEIHFGPPRGDRDVPPTSLRFDEHKQVRRAIACVLVIIFGDLARLRRQWFTGFFDQF